MFFKSSAADKTLQSAVNVLCDQFSMLSEEAEACCKSDKDALIVTLPFAANSQHPLLLEKLAEQGIDTDKVTLRTEIEPKRTKVPRLNRVKNIIAVASGKGGVGKSTTSINLAFALMQEGARVGILDADIYGPSVPIMLGNPKAQPQSEDQRHMFPLEAFGIVANSIGYLVPAENATIWRGPMVSRALQQLTNETLWPELDYLIVDMPPGTGDIQLTLAQQVPVTGAVVVTTPQDLALSDAIKGIAMFEKVDIPVLGLVENMSYHQCKNCGHKEYVFDQGGGETLAKKYSVDMLGALPLDISIRQHADGGRPLLVDEPDCPLADAYRAAARRLSQTLANHADIETDNSIQIMEKR